MDQISNPNDELSIKQLNQKLDFIISLLRNSDSDEPQIIGKKWVPEKKAQEITGKKATTLWKMRTSGLLTYTKINSKVYYDLESILSLLDKNKQEAFK